MSEHFGLLTHPRFLYFNDGLEFQVRRFFYARITMNVASQTPLIAHSTLHAMICTLLSLILDL